MKKPIKLGLWLLGFAVLALLGLWLEHERAKARLAAFKAQLIAKGEKLTFSELAGPHMKAGEDGASEFFRVAERLPGLPDSDAKLFQPHGMKLITPGRARVAWRTDAASH